MKNKKYPMQSISTEVIAAYLSGTATAAETQQVLDALAHDAELRETLAISLALDEELSTEESLPMAAMAAQKEATNTCSIECELKVLKKFAVDLDMPTMLQEAQTLGVLTAEGTYLFNVGRLCEANGLVADRQYNRGMADIVQGLKNGDGVIAIVNGEGLSGSRTGQDAENIMEGGTPNHAVVIEDVDEKENTIILYDPNSPDAADTYPIQQFLDAWQDSQCYLVCVNTPDRKSYIPHPIELSDVSLPGSLHDLQEAIAENAHEVWAAQRQSEGWTYGEKRDDDKKQTPDMIPYAALPESEKRYDREMAMNTLKLIKKLGYFIIK